MSEGMMKCDGGGWHVRRWVGWVGAYHSLEGHANLLNGTHYHVSL